MPYHLGFTCDEFLRFKNAIKCRYCGNEITNANQVLVHDVCNKEECVNRFSYSCKKTLPCGHHCLGVNGELECPPCLIEGCPNYGGKFGIKAGDNCVICQSEVLSAAPSLSLGCGHYVHYQCLKKQLLTKWTGPKITFNHIQCPQCKKIIECNYLPEISNMLNEQKKLYEEIKDMSLKRLKFEDLDKDPRLTDPNSP